MHVKMLYILLTVACFVHADDLRLEAPDYAEPGDLIQIGIYGGAVKNMVASLFDERGNSVSRSEGFPWTTPAGEIVNVALLGLPSTATPGRYRLTVSTSEGNSDWSLEQRIQITKIDFDERVIVLNEVMHTVYTDTSEKKKEESRILWSILSDFNSDAIYHKGRFIAPVDSDIITSKFGERRRYRMPDGAEKTSVHFGQDFWSEKGTPIWASGHGRVVMATERILTGNTVILEHLPGVYSLYYHLDSIVVRVGEMVSQGDRIGTLGDTGFATGEHLHWELRVGGIAIQPTKFLMHPLLDTHSLIGNINMRSMSDVFSGEIHVRGR